MICRYFQSLPPVAKTYAVTCLMFSGAYHLGLYHPQHIALDYGAVIKRFQVDILVLYMYHLLKLHTLEQNFMYIIFSSYVLLSVSVCVCARACAGLETHYQLLLHWSIFIHIRISPINHVMIFQLSYVLMNSVSFGVVKSFIIQHVIIVFRTHHSSLVTICVKLLISWKYRLRYGVSLERGPFDKRTADYVWMFFSGALALLVIAVIPFLHSRFMGASLVFMIVYVWGREFPNERLNIHGLFQLKVKKLQILDILCDHIFNHFNLIYIQRMCT